MRWYFISGLVPLMCAAISVGAPIAVTYTEDFDSMGTAGTSPPVSGSMKTGNSGTSNTTWAASITANGSNSVATMVSTAGALTATAAPSGTNNNGFNAGAPGDASNRL